MTSEEEKDGNLVKRKVYDHLLLPILQGAVEQGDLTDFPPVEKVLEAAQVLPARDAKTGGRLLVLSRPTSIQVEGQPNGEEGRLCHGHSRPDLILRSQKGNGASCSYYPS